MVARTRKRKRLGSDGASLQTITFNLAHGCRYDEMAGRRYLVCPMVMAVEGVLTGSDGPLFYPGRELARTPAVWNHKPVIIRHPEDGTACRKSVLNRSQVGVIMNAYYDKGKLRAEAWLEESRLKKIDVRVWNSIQRGELVEVSTGVYTDNEEVRGVYNGRGYKAIARNYRPDHLAILPDERGASSVADGAGLMQMNARKLIRKELRRAIKNQFNSRRSVAGAKEVGKQKERTMKVTTNKKAKARAAREARQQAVGALIANERTAWDEDDRDFLEALPAERLDTFVSNAEALDGLSDDSSEEEEAPRRNSRKAKSRKPVRNEEDDDDEEEESDEDSETEEQDEDDKPAKNSKAAKWLAKHNRKAKKPTKNAKPVDDEAYLKTLPPGIRAVVEDALATNAEVRDDLIEQIITNEACEFDPEELEGMATTNLKKIAAMCGGKKDVEDEMPAKNRFAGRSRNYVGAGAAPSTNSGTREKPLGLPVMNFGKDEDGDDE